MFFSGRLRLPNLRVEHKHYLLQNPKIPKNVMGFSNRAQRFTAPNYLDVDSPFEAISAHLPER